MVLWQNSADSALVKKTRSKPTKVTSWSTSVTTAYESCAMAERCLTQSSRSSTCKKERASESNVEGERSAIMSLLHSQFASRASQRANSFRGIESSFGKQNREHDPNHNHNRKHHIQKQCCGDEEPGCWSVLSCSRCVAATSFSMSFPIIDRSWGGCFCSSVEIMNTRYNRALSKVYAEKSEVISTQSNVRRERKTALQRCFLKHCPGWTDLDGGQCRTRTCDLLGVSEAL